MKRIIVVLLFAVFAVAIGVGCASTPVKQALKGNPELQAAYHVYQAIDMANLTAEQQEALVRLQGKVEFSEFDQRLIAEFSWIDPNNLTDRDLVFLAGAAEEIVLAIQVANAN